MTAISGRVLDRNIYTDGEYLAKNPLWHADESPFKVIHTLGFGAGVDFPYMLFADQVGEFVEPCRGRSGISWIRLITDIPTGVREICRGRQNWKAYFASLCGVDVESVFCREDPLPGFAELALLPYLSYKQSL